MDVIHSLASARDYGGQFSDSSFCSTSKTHWTNRNYGCFDEEGIASVGVSRRSTATLSHVSHWAIRADLL